MIIKSLSGAILMLESLSFVTDANNSTTLTQRYFKLMDNHTNTPLNTPQPNPTVTTREQLLRLQNQMIALAVLELLSGWYSTLRHRYNTVNFLTTFPKDTL